ncbi:MAG: hypothetical protein J6Z49_05380 [Kiritimatiellae bacterium]|nr:hypothetical protein [Kiritimatiellia bacterium]
MQLTNEQTDAVRAWVDEGASLSEVQTRLKETFGLEMTYLDVRLLVLDIGASVKDKPDPKKKEEQKAEPAAPDADGEFDEAESGDEEDDGQTTPSRVSVTLDKIVVPGAMVSGEVTFSDGTKSRWLIDQYGRFGLDTQSDPGYRPSEDDLRSFQTQLRTVLRQNGYA